MAAVATSHHRMTKAEWIKVVKHWRRRDDPLFVNEVIHGLHRGFIPEKRAVEMLTDVAPVPRTWEP